MRVLPLRKLLGRNSLNELNRYHECNICDSHNSLGISDKSEICVDMADELSLNELYSVAATLVILDTFLLHGKYNDWK